MLLALYAAGALGAILAFNAGLVILVFPFAAIALGTHIHAQARSR